MIQRCQGFKDLLPEDMASFRKVEKVFIKVTQAWGYQEVRTPTIEYLYLFTSAGTLTPGKLRRTYSFLDWDGWSGERVVLKPDATIPVARMYAERLHENKHSRLAYITNTFMFDDTGKKTRERWQCGSESIGPRSALADAELIAVALEVARELKIPDISIRLSHAGLLAALLEKAGLSPQEYNKVFDELLDGNEAAFDRVKEADPDLARVFSLMIGMDGGSANFLKNLKALLNESLIGVEEIIDNFIEVTELVKSMGIPFEINLASAKGYEYYTGVIFHILSSGDLIGGGGRYDKLVSLLGGTDSPAAGFALYMDKMMCLSGAQDYDIEPGCRVIVRPKSACSPGSLKIALALREKGIPVEIDSNCKDKPGQGYLIEVDDGRPFLLTDPQGQTTQAENVEDLVTIITMEPKID